MSNDISKDSATAKPLDFIRQIVKDGLRANQYQQIVTRFPPEPNGYLHIGHAKSICINSAIATENNGRFILRYDDTNPLTENKVYIQAIEEDVRWLGFVDYDKPTYASDYFPFLYEFAWRLIEQGQAYVCNLSTQLIREYRGNFTKVATNSPWRDRAIDENLTLFTRMKEGEFADGECVLRARIDMHSPNLNMRDPVLYRIRHALHPRTENQWCIYPMYDFAHCLSDLLEGVTHSICSLEFEDHRPLYDWLIRALSTDAERQLPKQYEFSRLMIDSVPLSKRMLKVLVDSCLVTGWDDPRMWTLAGLRRLGVPAQAIRAFCGLTGVTKKYHVVEIDLFKHCLREELEDITPRAFAVIDPVRVIIDNYPEDQRQIIVAQWHPKKPELGSRDLPFSREIFIDKSDFALLPPAKFKRLTPGVDVRLRYSYILHCKSADFSSEGELTAIHCDYYKDSLSGSDTSGIKARSVIQWVPAEQSISCEMRFYDKLFTVSEPGNTSEDVLSAFNHESVQAYKKARLEPELRNAQVGSRWQFERLGYFCRDSQNVNGNCPLWHRTVDLRSTWKHKKAKNKI